MGRLDRWNRTNNNGIKKKDNEKSRRIVHGSLYAV
jgi:hypothetical protein